jgi:hypothetical protein
MSPLLYQLSYTAGTRKINDLRWQSQAKSRPLCPIVRANYPCALQLAVQMACVLPRLVCRAFPSGFPVILKGLAWALISSQCL